MKKSWPFVIVVSFLLLVFACGRMAEAQTTPPVKTSITIEQALYFCALSYDKFNKGDKGVFFDAGMKLLSPAVQYQVKLICVGYGAGYDNGKKWKGPIT